MSAGSVEVLGETCIDGGTCHHGCTERCFRRECCGPFSGYEGPWEYPKAGAQPEAQAGGEVVKARAGNLPTMNAEEYPGMGDWWVQVRVGDGAHEIYARCYGDSPRQAMERAQNVARLLNAPPPSAVPEPCPYVVTSREGTSYCSLNGPSAVPANRGVECKANRGKNYRVTFGTHGEPTVVESAYRRWNDTGTCYRKIWTGTSGKPMSIIVACAVRAAMLAAAPGQKEGGVMYGNMGEGLGGCLVVMAILAAVGLIALCAGAWWLFSNISIVWGSA